MDLRRNAWDVFEDIAVVLLDGLGDITTATAHVGIKSNPQFLGVAFGRHAYFPRGRRADVLSGEIRPFASITFIEIVVVQGKSDAIV